MSEILRRTKKARAIITAVFGAFLIISYVSQIVNWLFSFPLFSFLSTREIFAVAVLYITIVNREELSEFIRVKQKGITDRYSWFQKFEEAEGLQKLKLLKEKQQMKKKKKEILKKMEQSL